MAEETELKLEIDAAAIPQLLAADQFAKTSSTGTQISVYFDTPDQDLRKAGYSLRIRRSGETRTQTVKATSTATAGLFARSEWEFAVADDVPVIDHATPLRSELGSIVDRLLPQFEVHVQRTKWTVIEGETEIEMVLDVGFAKAAGRQAPICEIELELKDGQLQDIFVLARKIDAIAPFRFGALSKSERGYQLLNALQPAIKAEPVVLDPRRSATNALQAIAAACLRHFRLNETILLERRNAAALHQSRVALRRLRSALSLFKPMLGDQESERLKGELKWLASVLGEARNIDVLLTEARGEEPRRRLTEARAAAYDAAFEALNSPRARALTLDFNEWLACGAYLSNPATEEERSTAAADFAAKALDRQRRKIKKHGEALAKANDDHRHRVRKDAKKLRYASEFFRSLFDDKKSKRRHRRFLEVMEHLQDILGELNDMAMRPAILERLGAAEGPVGGDGKAKAKLLDKAEAALEDLLEAKRFWR